jgi:RNA polymerase sigma-70 factor (ECF subfamily)
MGNVPKGVGQGARAAPSLAEPVVRRWENAEEERDLVRQAQNGTAAAYEELVRRNQQRVFAVVGRILRRREDVEDVAQQVFIKAYLSLKRFDLRSAFSTWLYKIAVNECWDYLRKKRVRPLLYEADLSDEQAQKLGSYAGAGQAGTDPSERAELGELTARLLGQLSDQDRAMLVLKEVEGFSVQEIGEMFDLNVNTVKVRLFRARGKLMQSYRRRLGESSAPGAGGRKKS